MRSCFTHYGPAVRQYSSSEWWKPLIYPIYLAMALHNLERGSLGLSLAFLLARLPMVNWAIAEKKSMGGISCASHIQIPQMDKEKPRIRSRKV